MSAPEKFPKAIAALYNNPTFAVKQGNKHSDWKTQHSGIRQGCPLSPYLFIIVMTVMFRDIYDCVNLERGTLHPVNFTDLMYADDTALITNNCNAMNRLLGEIEFQADYCGLNFNKDRCVSFVFNHTNSPKSTKTTRCHVLGGAKSPIITKPHKK